MTAAQTYPVGLTPAELEQRAWVEGDLRTCALMRAARRGTGSPTGNPTEGRPIVAVLAQTRQLPLEMGPR